MQEMITDDWWLRSFHFSADRVRSDLVFVDFVRFLFFIFLQEVVFWYFYFCILVFGFIKDSDRFGSDLMHFRLP